MELQIESYARRPFSVKAVQVTDENMEAVAEWCNGSIEEDDAGKRHIKVKVENPLTERQTRAYVGDRVLYAGRGYKVYREHAFKKSFVREGGTPHGVNSSVFEGTGGEGVLHPDGPSQGNVFENQAESVSDNG